MSGGKTLAVFSIRPGEHGSIWTRIGKAVENRDGSLNIFLDALPIDGKLHVRELPRDVQSGDPFKAD